MAFAECWVGEGGGGEARSDDDANDGDGDDHDVNDGDDDDDTIGGLVKEFWAAVWDFKFSWLLSKV